MAENRGGGNFLQTPDFIHYKTLMAQDDIGRHLLIAALFEGGAVIGHRFRPRQQEARQWIYDVDNSLLLIGWGSSLEVFRSVQRFAYEVEAGLQQLLRSDRYVTPVALYKKIAGEFADKFESRIPYPLDVMLLDLISYNIYVINFAGRVKKFSGFGIIGGYNYQEEIGRTPFNFPDPSGTKYPMEFVQTVQFAPLKDAVAEMLKNCGEKDFLKSSDEAVGVVKNALLKFDPPSKHEQFEINIFDQGEFKETIYFKRDPQPKPAAIKTEDKSKPADTEKDKKKSKPQT